jgi:hypothetical protein
LATIHHDPVSTIIEIRDSSVSLSLLQSAALSHRTVVMELYFHVASWLPPDCLYEQVQQFKAPESSQQSSLATGAFFVALATLLLRILANRSVPKCLPRNPDILVALKTSFAIIYISGTVSMLVYAVKERRHDWILLIAGVATAVSSYRFNVSETRSWPS